ncbi:aminotransferase class I and II domain-containing protein [Phthorimaea operculella]|nr:aminotransferase class I and II domain-containing protein [Phthorimaea operculella]
MDTINPNIVKLQYAVRGPLVVRAAELEKELKEGAKKPFTKVIRANLGDAQAMGQKPITWIRQVLACCVDPTLISKGGYPEDVQQRAKELLGVCGGGSVGAYSASTGIERILKNTAKFIEDRDGYPSIYQDIVITAGASLAIKNVLALLINEINGKQTGVMVPIPQYPLYSASIAEFGMVLVGYYLDEDNNWGLDLKELERAYDKMSSKCAIRAIVVINPGNPTGQVLSRQNIEDVIKFARERKLLLFADEVYQHNIYVGEFHSFKKVMMDLGGEYAKKQELASFLSCSKGYMGECGLRGGYVELVNFDKDVQANLYKAISATLCPTVLGQITLDCVVKPPSQGDPSYDLWAKEKEKVLSDLETRSKIIVENFNKMDGFKCNVLQGAMYAFPRIDMPQKAIEAAKKDGKAPDVFYSFRLLEETGICIVPGSGFEQKPGTHHFRTTILPQTPLLKEILGSKFCSGACVHISLVSILFSSLSRVLRGASIR